MDVARAIRDEQLTVEQQFRIDEVKARIRDRLLESARISGDHVSEAEIDAAISVYFQTQFIYHDPPWGMSRLLAQLYVWRVKGLVAGALGGVMLVGVWLAFFNDAMPWSNASQTAQIRQQVEHDARSVLDQLNILKKDPAAEKAVDDITKEFHAIEASGNVQAIRDCQARMNNLLTQLREQYRLEIVGGSPSLISRRWNKGGEGLAYYAIVEAKNGSGQVLSRAVKNAETGQTSTVTRWAEQIPKEVFDRLAADKRADGILNETLFAEKPRGTLDEKTVLSGTDNQPIPRQGTITNWD